MTIVLGVLLGLALGVIVERGGLCFNRTIRKSLVEGDARLLFALLAALAVQWLALPLVDALGLASPRPLALRPLAGALGGLAFGVGMALAGGCITGTLTRVGRMRAALLIALAGFVIGELLVREGPLRGLATALGSSGTAASGSPTLASAIGVPLGVISLPLGVVGLALARRARLGIALGFVGVLAWIVAKHVGYGYGLGFVGAADATYRGNPGLPVYVALGVIAGAALASRHVSGLRLPDGRRAARALTGGLLMGVGGTVAGGCNIGHGLTGIGTLSLGSLWVTAWITVGALCIAFELHRYAALGGRERAAR